MKMTQEILEEQVVDMMLDHGKFPRYVFMDAKTYQSFCDDLRPRERNGVNYAVKITKFYPTAAGEVGIYEVLTEDELFVLV